MEHLFNNKNYYQLSLEEYEDIENAMCELLEFSQACHIPMFITAAVGNGPNGTEYIRYIYTAQAHNLVLADDRIRRHALIVRGFDAILPRDNLKGNIKKEITEYAISDTQKEDLNRIIKEISNFCSKNYIPVFLSVAVKNSKEGTKYKVKKYIPSHIRLADNQLEKHQLVQDGFDVIIPRDNIILGSDK